MQHDVLGGADRRIACAEKTHARIGDSRQSEGTEGIVERNVDVGLALGVDRNPPTPKQQSVKQLPRILPAAAAAMRNGFAPIMTLADYLHLRRGGIHLNAPIAHHGIQQFP